MLRHTDIDNKDLSLTADEGPASRMVPVNQYVLNKLFKSVADPYVMDENTRARVIAWAEGVLNDETADARTKLAAAKIIQAGDEINIRRYEVIDKIMRLDNGQATDNVQVVLKIPDTVKKRANP